MYASIDIISPRPASWRTPRKEGSMLSGWVNPHREQQTIPQGQAASPTKTVFTPTATKRAPIRRRSRRWQRRGEPHTEHGLGVVVV